MNPIDNVLYFLKSLDITELYRTYIKNIFNDFILDKHSTTIQNFIIKLELGMIYNHETFKIDANENMLTCVKRYHDYLCRLSDNETYILLNKLQLLSYLSKNINSLSVFENINSKNINNLSILFSKELSRTDLGFSMDRIKHNYNCSDTIDKTWNKIYSNIKFDFNGDFMNFIPLDKTELLYKL
jgi:hypothetical protein